MTSFTRGLAAIAAVLPLAAVTVAAAEPVSATARPASTTVQSLRAAPGGEGQDQQTRAGGQGQDQQTRAGGEGQDQQTRAGGEGQDQQTRAGGEGQDQQTRAGGGDRSAGAAVPFVEQQAEDARTNGTVIGPDWAYGTLAAEAVGRRAVQLRGAGQYVEFTLTKPADAVNVRYSIPDTADGKGRDATLDVLLNGRPAKALPVTSRSWYYGVYPWTNTPADGGRRQLYDDSRVMLGATMPAGTKVQLQVPRTDSAPWYVIDSADFENVGAPLPRPRNSLSVLDFGADATGHADSSNAIQAAITKASGTGQTVWIPQGTFTVTRHLIVDKVTVRGAGPWYSVLHGKGVGVYGNFAPTPSSDVHLSDFAIFGEVQERNDADQVNAIGGSLAKSSVTNMWLQHTKVGMWLDGPFDGLRVSRVRIFDTTADGINFHDGITNSSVTDTFVRNTGDDGLAMWSEKNPDAHNVFSHNTVQVPTLANNIAIYGGRDNTVAHNLVSDTLTQGGGIQIANRFGATPLAGTTTVTGNVLWRTGTLDLFSHIGNPALWFWAGDEAMTGTVNVTGNSINNSAYSAIGFTGHRITNVHFNDDVINRAGTFAVQLNAPGSATFSDVVASRLGAGGRYDCNSGFTIIEGRGNRGWSDSHCGYPAPGPLTLSASNLNFVADGTGQVSDPQTVTVTNPTSTLQRIASVTATGSFTLSTTCGATLAPHTSCTVTLRFAPTAMGDHGGALTISDGTPAGRYQVYLQGTVQTRTVGNLAAGKPATASSQNSCCTAGNTTDSNTGTYWESAPGAAFPQTLTVDLGSPMSVSKVTLKINPAWGGTRTENFQILGSTDGTTFASLAPAADYTFNSATNNTVNIPFPATTARYLQVKVNSNSGWPAAQIAEFEVYK